jgi:hypothetical protein
MLALYLIALVVGGTMLVLSIVGGDHDHGDHGHGPAGGHHGALDVALGWLPITSLRFWIVFAAFFGLTGATLTLGGLLGPEPLPGAIAGGVGYVAGLLVVAGLRRLTATEVSSAVDDRDLVGASAEVLLPIATGAPGKVRLRLKDRAIDLTATTDDLAAIPAGVEVVVYAAAAGSVSVTRTDVARSP